MRLHIQAKNNANFPDRKGIGLCQEKDYEHGASPVSGISSTAVVGKTLVTYGHLTWRDMDTATYQITGVMKDIPAASHFHFDIIKSMAERHLTGAAHWVGPYCATCLLAKPGVTAKDVDRMLGSIVAKYVTPELEQQINSNLEEMTKHGHYYREYSIPLSRIHLYSNVLGEFESNGSIETVRIFMVIAVLILLIALLTICFRAMKAAIANPIYSLRTD